MDSKSCSEASASRWGKPAPSASQIRCPCHRSGPLHGLHTPCYAHRHRQMSPMTAVAATHICAALHQTKEPTVLDPKAVAAAIQSIGVTNAPWLSMVNRRCHQARAHPTHHPIHRPTRRLGTKETEGHRPSSPTKATLPPIRGSTSTRTFGARHVNPWRLTRSYL